MSVEPSGSALSSKNSHDYWIRKALRLAQKAYTLGEVPIGALIIKDNRVIGQGFNQREGLNDPTAHAEILAITAASNTIGNWRLENCDIYVTKEPCPMCAGAIISARIRGLFFGAFDEKKGCCGSLYQLCGDRRLDSITSVRGGIVEDECSSILKEFFISKRGQ